MKTTKPVPAEQEPQQIKPSIENLKAFAYDTFLEIERLTTILRQVQAQIDQLNQQA